VSQRLTVVTHPCR